MFHKIRYLLKTNMRFFLDQELLRDGNYDNVNSGTLFYDGSDMSVLVPDTAAETLAEIGGLAAGQVWQSAFINWMYEDAPPLNPSVVLNHWPIAFRASGVFIDGAFRAEDDTVYPHTIDYLNGRIIFDDPLPLDTRVHAEFTYKTVSILNAREFNNQLRFGLLETQFGSNPRTSNQLIYPSGTRKIAPLPIIFLEDMGRTWDAYQLGDRSLIARDQLKFEIWALDESTRDNLIDLVSYQERKNVPIINYNIVPLPLSGIKNQLSPEFISYSGLALNQPLPGPSFSGLNPVAYRAYLRDTEVIDLESLVNQNTTQDDVFERAVVMQRAEIYGIMPISPFGLDFAPVLPKDQPS